MKRQETKRARGIVAKSYDGERSSRHFAAVSGKAPAVPEHSTAAPTGNGTAAPSGNGTAPPENGRESFYLGGCEVLRLEYRMPKGDDAAARHAAALEAALYGFVRGTLVGQAEAALEEAVRAGRGYRFSRYVCRVNGKIVRGRGRARLIVSFEVRAGEALLHFATAESSWDAPAGGEEAFADTAESLADAAEASLGASCGEGGGKRRILRKKI